MSNFMAYVWLQIRKTIFVTVILYFHLFLSRIHHWSSCPWIVFVAVWTIFFRLVLFSASLRAVIMERPVTEVACQGTSLASCSTTESLSFDLTHQITIFKLEMKLFGFKIAYIQLTSALTMRSVDPDMRHLV